MDHPIEKHLNNGRTRILRCVSLLLAVLLAVVPVGCGNRTSEPAPPLQSAEAAPVPTAEPTPAQTPEPVPTPEPTPAPNMEISLAAPFGEDSLTEETLSPDEIGFYYWYWDCEMEPRIEILPRGEVLAWHAAQETLPRPRFFESCLPE